MNKGDSECFEEDDMTNDELTKLWEDNKRFVYKMAGRYTELCGI